MLSLELDLWALNFKGWDRLKSLSLQPLMRRFHLDSRRLVLFLRGRISFSPALTRPQEVGCAKRCRGAEVAHLDGPHSFDTAAGGGARTRGQRSSGRRRGRSLTIRIGYRRVDNFCLGVGREDRSSDPVFPDLSGHRVRNRARNGVEVADNLTVDRPQSSQRFPVNPRGRKGGLDTEVTREAN